MIKKNSGIVSGSIGFASRAFIQIIFFIVTIVATRFLAISEFGIYSLASSFVLLSRSLFYVGPYEYLLKSKESESLKSSCLNANLALALLSGFILILIASLGTYLLKTHVFSGIILWLIPSIFIAATTAWYESIMLRNMLVKKYYIYTVVGEFVSSIFAIILLISGYGVISLVVQVYVRLLTLLILYRANSKKSFKFRLDLQATRVVIVWSWSRYAAVLLNYVTNYGADMILGVCLSPAATGIYRASNRVVSSLADMFAQPLLKIAQTNLSARVAGGQEVGATWLAMLAGVGAIGWAAIAALAFSARDIIPFVLGEKWSPAVPVVQVFCIVKSFSLLDAVTTALLVCHNRQRTMLWVQIAASCLVVGGSYIATGFGPTIVAMSVGAVTIGMSLIYAFLALRISRPPLFSMQHSAITALTPTLCIGVVAAIFQHFHTSTYRHLSEIIVFMPFIGFGFLLGAYPLRHRILSSISHLGHAV